MTTFTGQVSASSDDAHEGNVGLVSTSATTESYCFNNTVNYEGNRFLNVTVPNGATVSNCQLSVDFSAVGSSGTVQNDCENTATPATYSTGSHNVSTRSTTGNPVNWTMPPSSTGFQSSPSFNTAAQAVFALGGWSSGDNLSVITHQTAQSSSSNTGLTYDNSPSTAAEISITYTSGGAPPTPTGLAVTNDATNPTTVLDISWNSSSGATSYNLLQSSTKGGTYSTVQTGISGTSTTVTGLTAGTEYAFQIEAVGSGGTSSASSGVAWATEATAGLTLGTVTATSIGMSFNFPSLGATVTSSGVELRYEHPVGAANWTSLSIVTGSYTLTGLSPDTQYGIEVANIIDSTNSDWSGTIQGPWGSELTVRTQDDGQHMFFDRAGEMIGVKMGSEMIGL